MRERPKLGQLLVRIGAIDSAQLFAALGEQKRWGHPLGMTLVRMGFLDEETLVRMLARHLKLPIAWLRGKRVHPDVLALVPQDLAEKHRCMPLLVSTEGGKRTVLLAMEDPADLEAVDEISFRIGREVRPVLVAPSELQEAMRRHYRWADGQGDLAAVEATFGVGSEADQPELLMQANAGPEVEPPSRSSADASEDTLPVPPRPSRSVPAEVVLRALTQLLVEKGLLSREEVSERLRALARRPGSSRDASRQSS